MKKETNIIIALLVIIIVFLLMILGFILGSKSVNNNVDNNVYDTDIEQDIQNSEVETYEFGQEVTLEGLSAVDLITAVEDFSKWNVLSDDGEYVTLYSANVFNKISNVSENRFADVLVQYKVDLGSNGEVRGLNEKDLNLLGCNINSKSCSNVPSWAGYSLTQVVDGNNLLVFKGNADFADDNTVHDVVSSNDGVLVYYRPVIEILKSNIK